MLRRTFEANLLRNVMARGTGVLVFLFGVYIILRVSGLTQLALTVVGGTGLIGLAVGIAFRDITENFLASVFLSLQRPFATGDLIEVTSVTGYVQQLNVRTTILMTLDGNLVQIPNATVYKSNLRKPPGGLHCWHRLRRLDQRSSGDREKGIGGPSGGSERPGTVSAGRQPGDIDG